MGLVEEVGSVRMMLVSLEDQTPASFTGCSPEVCPTAHEQTCQTLEGLGSGMRAGVSVQTIPSPEVLRSGTQLPCGFLQGEHVGSGNDLLQE